MLGASCPFSAFLRGDAACAQEEMGERAVGPSDCWFLCAKRLLALPEEDQHTITKKRAENPADPRWTLAEQIFCRNQVPTFQPFLRACQRKVQNCVLLASALLRNTVNYKFSYTRVLLAHAPAQQLRTKVVEKVTAFTPTAEANPNHYLYFELQAEDVHWTPEFIQQILKHQWVRAVCVGALVAPRAGVHVRRGHAVVFEKPRRPSKSSRASWFSATGWCACFQKPRTHLFDPEDSDLPFQDRYPRLRCLLIANTRRRSDPPPPKGASPTVRTFRF